MQNLTQEGVDAFKAGNKSEAAKLLTQAAQQNSQDETAWLYLGLALDLPDRKRQCFQRVLAINPANQQAKDALAALDAPTSASSSSTSSATSGPSVGSSSSSSGPAAGPTAGSSSGSTRNSTSGAGASFANPIHVDGAPATLTVTYVIDTARMRIDQAIKIYSTRDMDAYYQMAQGATLWDAVFIVGLAGLAAGAAQLVGGLIGFCLLYTSPSPRD